MTFHTVTDVPCEGCPDTPYPFGPQSLSTNPSEGFEELSKNLPKGTSGGPLPEADGIEYSVFWAAQLGQYAEDQLSQIGTTFPVDVQICVSNTGDIKYEKGPDGFEPPGPINGYERDEEDPWLFHPIWESCTYRHYTSLFKTKCQCVDVLAKCSISDHWVGYEDCLKCGSRCPLETYREPIKKTRHNLRMPDLDHTPK